MIKRGFTLAEILIALGIVGVVAALTIPTFVNNGRNQANASKLSVTVNAVENALTSMIARESADDMTDTQWYSGGFTVSDLGNYLKLNGSKSNKLIDYYSTKTPFTTISGTANNPSVTNIYETKNGALLMFNNKTTHSQTEATVKAYGGSVYDSIGMLSIDVNGAAKPNVWGRDVFYFLVGSDGHLYPAGSLNFSILFSGKDINMWNKTGSYNCTTSKTLGCTARLIEEGYQVNY